MSKVKLLGIIALSLVALNLVVLFIYNRPPGRPHKQPKQVIIEELQFDDAQIAAYEKLISKHRKEIDDTQEEMMELRRMLYSDLKGTAYDALTDSLTNQVGRLQAHIEQVHFHHFEDIRKLCRGRQVERFDKFSDELVHLFDHPKKPR